MVYKFLDTKSSGSGVSATEPNYQFANGLDKRIIKKFKKQKVYSSFRDNFIRCWFSRYETISRYNKGIKYLLCAIDFYRNVRGLFL